jgi:aminopeptidase YwaD
MLAVGEGWPLVGDTAVVNAAGEEAEKIGMLYQLGSLPAGVGSDHAPFQEAGIPAIMLNCFCDPNYHTAQDRVEFLKTERVGLAGALGVGLVERLLGGAQ